jgi:sugar phosphate isomerase/epimerase
MMTIALSTGSLYTYGMARVFDLAADAGFDGVELLVDERWDSRQPEYLSGLSGETGLPILAVHSPFKPFVPGWPRDPVGRLRETVALARAVGALVAVAHLPLRFRAAQVQFYGFQRGLMMLPIPLGGEKAYRHFLLNGLADFEAEQGIPIAVENMPVRHAFGHNWDIHWLNDLETLAQMPHLTLDTTHIGTRGLDLLAVYERLKARITHVHLSDFDGREHRLPGSGRLPLADLLRRLSQDGYTGTVTVELGPEVLEAEDEALVRGHLRRALVFCREHAGQK